MVEKKICLNKKCSYGGKPQSTKNFWRNKKTKDGLFWCCKDCKKRYAKNWYKKNIERVKKGAKIWYKKNTERAKNNVTIWQEKNLEKVKKIQKNFQKKNPNYNRNWRKEIKKDIFNHYGNKCIRCGEKDIRALNLNHKNGNGTQHINSLKKKWGTFYIYIKKNNYPLEYNTLCENHNWIEHCEKKLEIPYINKENFQVWLISVSSRKKRYWKDKYEVIKHYTNGKMKCSLCPQNDIRVLTRDHITPRCFSGEKEKENNKLIKEGFPSGIRILCMNCQRKTYEEWKQKASQKGLTERLAKEIN